MILRSQYTQLLLTIHTMQSILGSIVLSTGSGHNIQIFSAGSKDFLRATDFAVSRLKISHQHNVLYRISICSTAANVPLFYISLILSENNQIQCKCIKVLLRTGCICEIKKYVLCTVYMHLCLVVLQWLNVLVLVQVL